MLAMLISFVLSLQPLTAVGTDEGVWFVGDRNPAQLQLNPQEKGLEFSVNARTSKTSYVVLQALQRRPVALILHNDAVWFVDQGENIALFRMRKTEGGGLKATLRSVHEYGQEVTDVVSWNDAIVVCSGTDQLRSTLFDGVQWKNLPTLAQVDAQVVEFKGQLLAFTPKDGGATQWDFANGDWVQGEFHAFEGELQDVLVKDGWTLFIAQVEENCNIVGIQNAQSINIASFVIPKGRWAVLPSSEGLTVLGVQRNGTTNAIDISWPSGRQSSPFALVEDEGTGGFFTDQFPLFVPLALFLMIVVLLSRRGKVKIPKK